MKSVFKSGFIFAVATYAMTSMAFAGDFSQTCTNISMHGSKLVANCRRMDQRYKKTAINLDRFIGNINGVLSWNDGNFSQTCTKIHARGGVLKAVCKRMNGSLKRTSIDLDEGISNINGNLKLDR